MKKALFAIIVVFLLFAFLFVGQVSELPTAMMVMIVGLSIMGAIITSIVVTVIKLVGQE